MSETVHAMRQAVLADYDDDLPRTVGADAVEEAGQPELAELIRVQCALSQMKSKDPRRKAYVARQNQLLNSAEVTAHLRDVAERLHFPMDEAHIRMRRGMPEEIIWPQDIPMRSRCTSLKMLADEGIRSIVIGQGSVHALGFADSRSLAEAVTSHHYPFLPCALLLPRPLWEEVTRKQMEDELRHVERLRCDRIEDMDFFPDLLEMPFPNLKCLTIVSVKRTDIPDSAEINEQLNHDMGRMLAAPQFSGTFFNFGRPLQQRLTHEMQNAVREHNQRVPKATRTELALIYRDYNVQKTGLDKSLTEIPLGYDFGTGAGAGASV